MVLPLGKTGAEYRQYITEYQELNALLGSALRDARAIIVGLAMASALALLGTAYVLSAFL